MTRSRPPITGFPHTLPFDSLSPIDFEQLCLRLIEREGYERAEISGAAGSERGCDIVAWREGKRWAFHCRRARRLGPKQALASVEHVLALAESERPMGLLFVVTCDVSAQTRQRVRGRCAGQLAACRREPIGSTLQV